MIQTSDICLLYPHKSLSIMFLHWESNREPDSESPSVFWQLSCLACYHLRCFKLVFSLFCLFSLFAVCLSAFCLLVSSSLFCCLLPPPPGLVSLYSGAFAPHVAGLLVCSCSLCSPVWSLSVSLIVNYIIIYVFISYFFLRLNYLIDKTDCFSHRNNKVL